MDPRKESLKMNILIINSPNFNGDQITPIKEHRLERHSSGPPILKARQKALKIELSGPIKKPDAQLLKLHQKMNNSGISFEHSMFYDL